MDDVKRMEIIENFGILDSAATLESLELDLGLRPIPKDVSNWNTIEPVEGGYYEADDKLYIFTDGKLIECED